MSATVPSPLVYPAAVMVEARQLHAAGWHIHAIRRLVERQYGRRPAHDTVRRWVDDNHRVAKNAQVATRQRCAATTTATFHLPSSAPEYQAAFARRLRAEGEPVEGIARVCRVVFGGHWTGHRIRKLLEVDR